MSTVVEVALALNSLRATGIRAVVAHGSSVVVELLRNAAVDALLEEHENVLNEVERFRSL